MKTGQKLWALRCLQGFSMIWPTDLIFVRHDPYLNLPEILSRWSFWGSLMKTGPKLWPLECSEGFSMIWPTDLVFDPTSLIFKLDWDIVKMIILSNFDKDWIKTLYKVFLQFDQLRDFLTQHVPYLNLSEILSRSFWASLMKIGTKLWPQECSESFSMIWLT